MPETIRPDFEERELQRSEYISAVAHFYRGELERANTWRIRLDTTTNWAIVSTIGILSFAFGAGGLPSASIILGMYLVANFLFLEARRYRFFDVWKNRVRMLEENFYTPLLRRDLVSPKKGWGRLVAEDLRSPHFKITYLQALKNRLKRNYIFLFLILLAGWIGRLLLFPKTVLEQVGDAFTPLWLSISLVAALYLFLVGVLILVPEVEEPKEEHHWTQEGEEHALPDF